MTAAPDRGARPDRLLVAGLVGLWSTYQILLLFPLAGAPAFAREQLLSNGVYLLAFVVLARKARREPAERYWLRPLSAGMLLVLAANVYYYTAYATVGVGFPSPADALWLLSYLGLAYGLLAPLLRYRGSRVGALLDVAIAACAGASVAAVVLSPMTDELVVDDLGSWVSIGYSLGDVVLVGAATAGLGLFGLRRSGLFSVALVGLVLYTAADLVYLLQLSRGTYVEGAWLDGIWGLGIMLLTVAAWRFGPPLAVTPAGAYSPAVVAVGGGIGVLVLVYTSLTGLGVLGAVLGGLAFVLAGVRALAAFRQASESGRFRRQALTDDLTGATNRRGFYQRLDALLHDGAAVGVVLIDLDRFKDVNDTYGHQAGDELLVAVTRRFTDALAQHGEALLARLGGDEFAVLLRLDEEGVDGRPLDGDAVMERLQSALAEPVRVADDRLHVQASMGFARSPEHATERSELLSCADAAMYEAKSGQVSSRSYTPRTASDRRDRLRLAEDLYRALETDQIGCHYQPVVDRDGVVVAVEALVRWEHPDRGLLGPEEFLDEAERHRLSGDLTRRVLDVALGDLARWRAGGQQLQVAVNVGPSDLRDEQLTDVVAAALLRHGVPVAGLVVEVSERRLDGGGPAGLRSLRELGVEVAVDEFGSGHLALRSLLELDAQLVKIDPTLVAAAQHDERARLVLASAVQLGTGLGMRVVAEGVATEQVRSLVVAAGCDLVQGVVVCPPLPAVDLERWMSGVGRGDDDRPRRRGRPEG